MTLETEEAPYIFYLPQFLCIPKSDKMSREILSNSSSVKAWLQELSNLNLISKLGGIEPYLWGKELKEAIWKAPQIPGEVFDQIKKRRKGR